MDNPEIWIALIIVGFLIFGAKRMPDAARGLGRSLRIFKAETKGMLTDDEQKARRCAAAADPRCRAGLCTGRAAGTASTSCSAGLRRTRSASAGLRGSRSSRHPLPLPPLPSSRFPNTTTRSKRRPRRSPRHVPPAARGADVARRPPS